MLATIFQVVAAVNDFGKFTFRWKVNFPPLFKKPLDLQKEGIASIRGKLSKSNRIVPLRIGNRPFDPQLLRVRARLGKLMYMNSREYLNGPIQYRLV